MTPVRSPHIALADTFCSRLQIPIAAMAALKLAEVLTVWSERTKTRAALRNLDIDRLTDIGVTPEQARMESAKPFWRP